MATIPTTEPREIIAGTTIKWKRLFSDYPADTWTLTYNFSNADGTFSVEGVASDDAHLMTIVPATSTNLTAGEYLWHATVSDGTNVYLVGTNYTTVKASMSDGAQTVQTTAEQMLAAAKATMLRLLATDTESQSIAGRAMTRRQIESLRVEIDRLTAEVNRERAAADIASGFGNPNKVRVRF